MNRMRESYPGVRYVYKCCSDDVDFSDKPLFESVHSASDGILEMVLSPHDEKYAVQSWGEIVAYFRSLNDALASVIDDYVIFKDSWQRT